MEKSIRIFKSFEEQEMFSLEQMSKTTPLDRFKNLPPMQMLSGCFHPAADKSRKIVIQHGGAAQ
jgi:hypothetical protein